MRNDVRAGMAGLILSLLAAALPAGAQVRTVVVKVDASTGPWDVAANAERMPYGAGDQKKPVVIPFDLGGGMVAVYADGTTDTPEKKGVDAAGVEGQAVDDTVAKRKRRYPSFYSPKILYPSNLHALVCAFVDAKGVVLGRPVVIGKGLRVPIPEGATGLALGFNDVTFTGNTGELTVTVEFPDG